MHIASRVLSIRLVVLSVMVSSALGLLTLSGGVGRAGPAQSCAKVGTDDRVRPYDPALRGGFLRAYHRLFPQAQGEPLLKEGYYRCMGSRLLACFTGANLPCAKIDTARVNPGASTYCRSNPNADIVPLVASGHDSAYSYRCRNGRAEISGTAWPLDARGFAKSIWAPMD